MINRKPFNFVFCSCIWILFWCCKKDESLLFEKQRITTQILSECADKDCASIEVNMVQSLSRTETARRINQEIEKVACQILNIGENEPEASLEAAISEFNAFYQEMKLEYPEETVSYEVTIDFEISFRNQDIISLVIDYYTFTGGAHGYGAVSFLNLNAKTGKPISNQMLLMDYPKFEAYAETVFRKKYDISDSGSINNSGFFFENDVFTLPEHIGFSEEEIIMIYNPYEIGAYANGSIELRLKKSDVASFFRVNIHQE